MKPLISLKPSFYLLSLLSLFIGSCDKEQLHANSSTFEVITNEIVSPRHAAGVDENNFVVVGQNSEKGLVYLIDKQGIISQVFGFKGPYQSMYISEIQVDRQSDTYFICGSGRRAANQKDSMLLVCFHQKKPLDNYIFLKRQGNANAILINPDRTLILSGATENKAFLQKIDYTGKRIWQRQYVGTTALKTFENPKDTSEIISFILDGGNVDIAYINKSTGVEKRREELDFPFKSFPLIESFAIAENGDVLVADGIIEGLLANGNYIANTVIYRWDTALKKIKWKKSFPEQYVMQKIRKLDDQGYIVWGSKINSKNAVMVKLNADGEVEWEKIYPEIGLNSVLPAKDKGFYLIGTKTINKLYLAKTGQWGKSMNSLRKRARWFNLLTWKAELSNFMFVSIEIVFLVAFTHDTSLITAKIEWITPAPNAESIKWEYRDFPITVSITLDKPIELTKADFQLLQHGFLKAKMPNTATLIKKAELKYEFSMIFQLDKPGRHELKMVLNKANQVVAESKSILVEYTPDVPNLFILAIAPRTNLEYSTKDARDFASIFQNQVVDKGGRLFKKVVLDTLIGANATTANINQKINRLLVKHQMKEITSKDWVILFISTHGFLDETKGLRLQAEDFNSANANATSISYEEGIAKTMRSITCKKLIFIDACFSAGKQNSALFYENVYRINQQLVGTTTFVSSQGDEPSYEHKEWKNGAFTEAIINGLQYGRADQDWNQYITVEELATYIKLRVPEMVKNTFGKAQHPRVLINELSALDLYFKN